MTRREWGALFLLLLMACAGSPRRAATSIDPYEAELEASRYELQVLTAGAVDTEPVEIEEEDFQEAMKALARHVRASARPRETARGLMEGELQANLLAEVEDERVVRLVPQEEDSQLATASNAAGEVEAVAAPAKGTFTLMVRSPGSRAAAAAEAREGVVTIIRHQGGNRQVLYNNNQRWHVPADRSIKERQFPHLKWSPKGVDAVDPTTGIQYEILTRTESNMARHGRRMAEELFRMIGF